MESRLLFGIGICMSVVPICTILAQANNTYILTTLNSTWDNACFGNGPAVIEGIQFYPMKFPLNLSSTIKGARAWIGYYQRFNYFNLLGCLSVKDDSSLSLIDNTPSKCVMACGSCNYIGLEDNICHCLNMSEIGSTHFKNPVTCSTKMCNGTNFFCGTRGQMWVYGVNIGNTAYFDKLATTSNNEHRCLSARYNQWSGGAFWKFSSCLDHHKSLCELNGTVLDFAAHSLSALASWDEAARTCFNRSETPAGFEFGNWRNYNVKNFEEAWTAYIKDEVIQTKGLVPNPQGRIRCLSFSMSDGQPELHLEDCEDNLPSVCLAGVTPGTTTRTTTSAASTRGIISITSTISAAIKTSISSKLASSLSKTSASSNRQFADIKTPTFYEPQSTSRTISVPSASIGTNQSSSSTLELPAKESAIVNNEFPMYGRIGLGILFVLVIASIVIVFQRCKIKRINKGRDCANQTSVDPSSNISGMIVLDRVKMDVRTIEENEVHNTDKDTSHDCDRQPDPNYDTANIDDNAPQAAGRVLINSKDQSCDYATVDIAKKGTPKHI